MSELTPKFEAAEPVLDDTGSLKIESYTRRRFDVDVVKVTDENMELAARWCGGEIVEATEEHKRHIKVPVHRPLNPKQTMAFSGDRILQADTGFKVYIEKAFLASFVPKGEEE